MVAATKIGAEGLGASIKDLATYFYADYGLTVSTQPERMQSSFDILVDLLDWFGL